MRKAKIKLEKFIISIVLTITLITNSFIVPVHASSVASDNLQNTFGISSANDFPENIEKGQVYILTNDITLSSGQQIEDLEGTLGGKGFKITLADKPLENNVYGTIQNIGVSSANTISSEDTFGSMAVKLTSTYVPVKSVEQTILNSIEIHGRNANSSKIGAFNPQYYGLVIKPENARNCNNYTIESSDPTVGEYTASMVNGYVAYKAGTTTYKVSLIDVNPDTNEKRVVSSSQKTTYTYLNPLTSVTAPELIWTYDKEGIVNIEHRTNGFWKKNTDEYDKAPDKGLYLSSADYYITALSEGTVTAIGTPADNKNNVEAVKITVTVKHREIKRVSKLLNI